MSNEEKKEDVNPTSVDTSGPDETGKPSGDQEPQSQKTGEAAKPSGETVPKKNYEELVSKLSEQGKEVGDLRQYKEYVEGHRDVLEKLQDSPDLVDAIIKDKISPELIVAINEGKVSVKEAETITQAHKEVEKDLGKKEYDKSSPEEIAKLVADEVAKRTKDIESNLTATKAELAEKKEMDKFEKKLEKFVSSHPDYKDHAVEISEWLDAHPNHPDIEIAYDIVTGKKKEEKYKKDEEVRAAEAAKGIAANAGGGQSQRTTVIDGQSEASKYIAGNPNPNMSFSRPK